MLYYVIEVQRVNLILVIVQGDGKTILPKTIPVYIHLFKKHPANSEDYDLICFLTSVTSVLCCCGLTLDVIRITVD